jgi:tRNA modification GTPase
MVTRIIDLLIKRYEFRSAAPGEFTFRALKNKKLTLSQVEGLDLFLNAQSDYALDQGLSLLSGELQNLYSNLYHSLIKHRSALELMIDFSEDVGEETAMQYFQSSLEEFKKFLFVLYQRAKQGTAQLLQPEIVLLGKPNSGKSSLFNQLLSQDRAIVSPQAGTTRDYISESYSFNNVIYKLTDTAGLRETLDPIEAEGVKRTELKMAQAFFRILLINPLDSDPGILPEKYDLAFFTHSDLPDFSQARAAFIKQHPAFGSIGAISLKSADSTGSLAIINAEINKKYLETVSCKPILLSRHQGLIVSSWNYMSSYESLAKSVSDVGILSHELNALASCLEELIGIVSPHQVLDSVFQNFCIGK